MNALFAAIAGHAASIGHRAAIDPICAPPVTYADLPEQISPAAQVLAQRNDPARPIAVRLDHGADLALLDLALLHAGIVQLSLPAFFTAEQTHHALAASGAQALHGDGKVSREPNCQAVALPEGTARITFTSGSTGTPKGVCLSADHMLDVAGAVVSAVGQGHAGRHLALLPPGILLETVAGFYATLLAGGTYVCPPQALAGLANPFRPDFLTMVRRIAEWRVTSLILVPEYLSGLVAAMEASGTRLPLLTLVAVGGARTPPSLIERARALGLPARQGYGLTECGSVVALESDASGPPGSVGKVLPHMRLELADDGEILLHGPAYLGTIGSPRAAGPLATGDIGRIDATGGLWIEGRKSSLFVTSYGRNISPEWVEEKLLAQPGVAQAMVYGEGLASPEALLVPTYPDADLAAAVAAANATLPPYAFVARWRATAPFTPLNGHATGNGRMRRDAIIAAYGTGETPFFTELERRTGAARQAFLGVRQVQAGLSGSIPLQAYLAYLEQAYHHVRHTVPLMREARARLTHRPKLVAALDEYIAEETGHEAWILDDIAAAGGDADRVRRGAAGRATAAMVDHAYATIRHGNPAAFFGMVFVLESVSVALASRGAASVAQRLGLPPEAFTYLTSHGALDQAHMTFLADLVNGIDDAADREAIVAMACEIFALFGAMFADIPLETDRAAA
ncbi:AMP-binding protein [Novosphingobium lentum]|uniref:AMP-binding protein n=1 Tax=Novosphingobium lentum TaxID=145287 RepID=UPI00082D48C7|nr:AMP-binding protein [Novosphingobium lentum]